jgi:RNA polymerase-interacting CarD/CdnL/TRCF family regulator
MASKGPEIPIGDGSLHIGDRVVYPNQGICKINGVDVKQIAGRDWEMVTLSREEDGATVMVPRSKVMDIGLRKVASVAAIDEMFDQLAAPSDDPQLDWKVRHRENADRMTGGGLQGTLDVLKGLHALSQVRPLPQKERELYDNARHLIVGEISAAMNIPLHVAEDNLDYALFPPPGMKRKGVALKPAPLTAAAAAVVARARGEDDEDDLGLDEEEKPEAGETEPAAVVAADEEEAEIADRSETKDLVRQRVMRVAGEAEEPEALDDLAEEALEATHEDEAAAPSRKAHAPPGSTRPEAKRGAAKSAGRPKVGPALAEEPKEAPEAAREPKIAAKRVASLAKAIAAKALEAAATAIAKVSEEPAAEKPPVHVVEKHPPEKHVVEKHPPEKHPAEAHARQAPEPLHPERHAHEAHAEEHGREAHGHAHAARKSAEHEKAAEKPAPAKKAKALAKPAAAKKAPAKAETHAAPKKAAADKKPAAAREERALPATGGGRRPEHPKKAPARKAKR